MVFAGMFGQSLSTIPSEGGGVPAPVIHYFHTGNNINGNGTGITEQSGGVVDISFTAKVGLESLNCATKNYKVDLSGADINNYPVTICLWSSCSPTSFEPIIQWDNEITAVYPRIYQFPSGNHQYFRIYSDEGPNFGAVSPSESRYWLKSTQSNPNWAFMAFVFKSPTALKIYNDFGTTKEDGKSGIISQQGTDVTIFMNDPFPSSFWLGSPDYSTNTGLMNSIRVYDSELTLAEIQAIFDSEN